MDERKSLAGTLVREAGPRLFFVFWSSLVVVDVAAATRVPQAWGVIGIALVVALGGLRQRLLTAVAVAGTGWLFVNGFLENRLGALSWHGADDARILLLLVLAGVSAAAFTGIDAILTRGAEQSPVPRVRSSRTPGRPVRSRSQETHASGSRSTR